MILLGKYPLSFLPDTIGTPGSKMTLFFLIIEILFLFLIVRVFFYLFCPFLLFWSRPAVPGSSVLDLSDYQHDGATTPSYATVENSNEKCLV